MWSAGGVECVCGSLGAGSRGGRDERRMLGTSGAAHLMPVHVARGLGFGTVLFKYFYWNQKLSLTVPNRDLGNVNRHEVRSAPLCAPLIPGTARVRLRILNLISFV